MNSRYYVGGGSIAAVCGISPFQTPLDAYHSIVGTAAELDVEQEQFFARRKSLEPYVATVLSQRGFEVVKQNERYVDSEYGFFKAEIDAETADGWTNEFKTVAPFPGNTKTWGEDGHDEAPPYVTIQALWGLGVTGRERARVVAAMGFDDARIYPIERADDVIAWARSTALAFWENHVIPRTPPAPTTVADILTYITPVPDKTVEASDVAGLANDVAAFLEARTAAKAAEGVLEAAKAKIQLVMVDATVLTLNGKPVISWKPNKDSSVTDWKALALDLRPTAEQIEARTAAKAGARPFRPIGIK